jgi:murein DD-endopeptidase MepM/ murein hydrolase activator NlpD
LTALVVALFATVASARLFVVAPDQAQKPRASQDIEVAGHLEGPFIEDVEEVNPAPDPIAISITLEHTASVADYLKDSGLARTEANRWAQLFHESAVASDFQRGHSLTLYKDPETEDLRGLRYALNDRVAIVANTYGEGIIRSSHEFITYTIRPVAVSFRLKNDLQREAERNQLPKPIVTTLRYAFSSNRTLGHLPRGSNIKLIYQEKVSRDGTARFATGLEAAQIRFAGKTLSAFAFRDEDGQPHLYDSDGVALEPESLRFPVTFQYISSGFTMRRYHPILHAYRPHPGIDLATHYGTPVKAVADGRVEMAGWCGELGRCVRIKHENGIVSIYGHLSQISRTLERGGNVRVGEIIGRVGSSGLSTGPHLHFGLEKAGRYVNPLSETLGAHRHISPRMQSLFDHFKRTYLATMDRLPEFGGHFVAPRVTPAIETANGSGVLESGAGISHANAAARSNTEQTATAVMVKGRQSIMR